MTRATRRVKFYLELVIPVLERETFDVGDEIEFEGERLVVRKVERAGSYSGHPDALQADLVVRLTQYGNSFAELRELNKRAAAATT